MESDKYFLFSDSSCKNRVAFEKSKNRRIDPNIEPEPSIEPSGFTGSGWDKYYFFSVAQGVIKGNIYSTARKGRARPAMSGPQTFKWESFSPEDLQRAKAKGETGVRTCYGDSFCQLPRSKTHEHGPIEERSVIDMAKTSGATAFGSSGNLARSASDPTLRARKTAEIMAGTGHLPRSGPHWPPPGRERPDPLKTRQQLMQGAHRTIVDLHARDRQAPAAFGHTLTTT
jgi:hypothetical protein